MTSGGDGLRMRREHGALWLTLDRPEALNALDDELKSALVSALELAAADQAVRAVALAGAGRAFSVGQDLKELERHYQAGTVPDFAAELERHYAPAVRLLGTMPKPTVAVIGGIAVGAGLSLALACDLRIASDAASFRLAFPGIGLVPDAGATWHLPRLVGLGKALELLLLDEPVDAAQALRIGLVSQVVPEGELDAVAAATLARIAGGPTAAFGLAKVLLRSSSAASLPDALVAEAEAQQRAGNTRDHTEGVRAFVGKRRPQFEGS